MKKVTFALLLLSTLSFTAIRSKGNLSTIETVLANNEKDSLQIVSDTISKDSLTDNEIAEIKEVNTKKALVSWYGGRFHGRLTASGERYNMNELTAAHKTLPFGTKVKITNPKNGKEVTVRVTDRGPFVEKREFDLSKAAFSELTSTGSGLLNVHYEIL